MSVFRRDISIDIGDSCFKIESTVCSVYRVCAIWKSSQTRYDREVAYFILHYICRQLLSCYIIAIRSKNKIRKFFHDENFEYKEIRRIMK